MQLSEEVMKNQVDQLLKAHYPTSPKSQYKVKEFLYPLDRDNSKYFKICSQAIEIKFRNIEYLREYFEVNYVSKRIHELVIVEGSIRVDISNIFSVLIHIILKESVNRANSSESIALFDYEGK